MKKNFPLILVVVFALCFHPTKAQLITHTYDFNNLTIGNLNGQDNWTSVINTGGTFDLTVGYSGSTGLIPTPDNTLGIFYDNSGGNWGSTGSRTTTTALPFDFSSGGVAQIEAEIHTAYWGTFFGFGYDANSNGYLIPGIEQVVNYEANEGGFGIYLSYHLPNLCVFIKPDGTKIQFNYDSIAGWNHYKFFLDLDANGGAGSITMSVKKPNGNYVNIPQVQNLNLGLTPGSNDRKDPAKWTKLFIQGLGGYSGFDNIIISQPDLSLGLYQYLTFANVQTNFLTTDPPFNVTATSSLGLPVNYTVTGPATMTGNTVTLNGGAGTVSVTAHQPGNGTVAPAADVTVSFNVIDPQTVIPLVDIKNPVDNDSVQAPQLNPILFSVSAFNDYTDLIHISNVSFSINSQNIPAIPTHNGYYRAYWTPPSAGTYTLTATATTSHNVSASQSVTFQVVTGTPAVINYPVITGVTFANVPNQQLDTTLIFPSFSGSYSRIFSYAELQLSRRWLQCV